MLHRTGLVGAAIFPRVAGLGFWQRVAGLCFLIAVLAFATSSIWYGGRAAWTDAQTLQVRWQVNLWRDGGGVVGSPELWQKSADQLLSAQVRDPGNAQLRDDLGFLFASAAQALGRPAINSPSYMQQQALLARAIQSYRAATTLRPTFPYTWAYLALTKHLHGEQDAEYWKAFDKGLQFGGSEAGVQSTLAFMAFSQWDTLHTDRKDGIVRMVTTAHPKSRQVLLAMAAQQHIVLPE